MWQGEGRNKWQMLDSSQEPALRIIVLNQMPRIRRYNNHDSSASNKLGEIYTITPHKFIFSQFIPLYSGTALHRNEISDDQGNPSSGSTMWQKPGTLPGIRPVLGWINSQQPTISTNSSWLLFHPNQCLNPKWSLNIFPCLSWMREPAGVRVKQTGVKCQLWALLAGWHKKSYFIMLSFNLFSAKWETPDLPHKPAVMI